MHQTSILLPLAIPALTYAVPENMALQPGDVVHVPLGNKKETGVVWGGSAQEIPENKLKAITAKFPGLVLSDNFRKFIDKVAAYNMSPPGMVLKMALSIQKPPKKEEAYGPEEIRPVHIEFSSSQQEAVSYLKSKVKESCFSATLIDGVTGSGKTEVYFSAIEETFQDDSAQVLIMLPEIALTSQVVKRFEKHFGFTPLTWHSDMTPAQKQKTYRKVINGGTRLIIGARSALFLPYKNLKLVIVDEEHDASYKQEEGVIYNARDMAVLRAKIENFPVVMASATPAIETLENVNSGKYGRLHLPARHGGAVMPGVEIIDMRNQKLDAQHFLSHPLRDAIAENIAAKRQSLLFLNRRGYAPLVLCRNCGYRFQCGTCSSWLVKHKTGNYLMCHHCGFKKPEPKNCPECNEEKSLVACGPGVERVAEEVQEFFPNANIALMVSDNIDTPKKMAAMLDDILSGKVDIIIGTQVIAKGHHFPNLALVGVVDADLGLEGGDLRASERTYQLLHQVAGRAGREGIKGRVILQSYMPGSSVMAALRSWDRDSFLKLEADSRRRNEMPPYARLAAIIISGTDDSTTQSVAREITGGAYIYNEVKNKLVKVLGPVPAPIFLLRGKYRYRILVKAPRNFNLQGFLASLLERVKVTGGVKVRVDVDPYGFM